MANKLAKGSISRPIRGPVGNAWMFIVYYIIQSDLIANKQRRHGSVKGIPEGLALQKFLPNSAPRYQTGQFMASIYS